MTDDLTDDIFWIQGTRMPWFDTSLGHLKKEKSKRLIYVLYFLYIKNICKFKSLCYIKRTSFTSYIGEPR